MELAGLLFLVFVAAVALSFRDRLKAAERRRRQKDEAQARNREKVQSAWFETAKQLVSIINESLQIANNSKNPDTKVSRLNVAHDKLRELKAICEQFPAMRLTSLPQVEASIRELSHEFAATGVYDAAQRNEQRRAKKNSSNRKDPASKNLEDSARKLAAAGLAIGKVRHNREGEDD